MNCSDKLMSSNLKFSKEKGLICTKRNECTSSQHEVQICEIQGGGHYWPARMRALAFVQIHYKMIMFNFLMSAKKIIKN